MLRPLLALFALLCCAFSAVAQDVPPQIQASQNVNAPNGLGSGVVHPIDPRDLPEELVDWADWVLSRHPDLACPVTRGGRGCLWPGVLTVDARTEGASIDLTVQADRPMVLPLPGGAGSWPQQVRVDGRPTPVLGLGGVPAIRVATGRHRVSATIPWNTRPASLPMPALIGLVDLRVDGEAIAWPRIDGDGLRLGAVQAEEREGERLDLEVSRRIRDGVPLVVETLVVIRASGAGREVDLGAVGLPGTRPVSLSASLPARFTKDGSLVIQVRPGTWEARFESLHDGPVESLRRPVAMEPWPDVEYWAVATDDRVRAVNVGGAPGVDPARTTVPSEWRSMPVHAVAIDDALTFEELRRGEPEPAPNQVHLAREIWVDLDGGGLTVRDAFHGTMHRGWRLNVQDPARLGHVAASGEDQVITQLDGQRAGVELRTERVQVMAESRIESRPTALPAVGWDTDVQSLSVQLHLPPGWQLLAGTGIDNLDGSVLDKWTLFDLFFVLVLALATSRLLGRSWGALALVALVLARHESGAPQWTWAVLLVLVGLTRVVPEGLPRKITDAGRVLCLLVLAAAIVPFAVDQVQTGLFPALERPWNEGSANVGSLATEDVRGGADVLFEATTRAAPTPSEQRPQSKKADLGKNYFSSQIDPSAVVQTGPGVPTWSWATQPLLWSGPVSQDHTMRLFLLGPTTNAVLAILRVLLLLALALALAGAQDWRKWAGNLSKAAPAALALLLALIPATQALAAPDAATLAELEKRLTQPPACAPRCVDVARASLAIAGDRLTYEAEVHAAADSSWPIPGPTGTWVPSRVTVDGLPSTAMARLADGHLHVRLDAGVHRVRVEGPLPPTDVVALGFGIAPRRLEWSGEGWALDGQRADGTVDASVQLARMLGDTTTAQSAENLAPWLELHRELDLGIPWRVRTTLRRVGPTDYPVTVKLPLLPGEAVTEGGFEPDGGLISVTLDRDQRELTWLSTLETAETVVLTAPVGVPWTEVWTLSCSPIFHCTADGPAPLSHTEGGAWSPTWRVWPTETVTVGITRPPGVEGQTVTIDSALMVVRPGRRQLSGQLDLSIRSSQGGRQPITLPEGASLQTVLINGQARPLQLSDDHKLLVPIQPGAQQVSLQWQQPHPPSIVDRVPAVDLGSPAVNLTVVVEPMLERWLAALTGPRWGPVPLMWTYVLIVLGIAPLLARAPWSPLATWQWALLGLGMTQVPVFFPMAVVLWLMALALRKARHPDHPLAFNLVQLGLIALTVLALICLYASIHAGLLWQPDLQVAGGGSNARRLVWFVDRSGGAMPRPTVVSFPMWTWRVAMLAWSLWLAASLVTWLPWGFRAFTTDGWYRKLPLVAKPRRKQAAPAAPAAPDGADTDVTTSPSPSDEPSGSS